MYESRYRRYGLFPHIGILPGWGWLSKHEHNLDGWEPEVQMNLGNVKYSLKVKNAKTLKAVVKANK